MSEEEDAHFLLIRLARNATKGELSPEASAQQILDIQKQNPEMGSLVLDVLETLELELGDDDSAEEKERFKSLCSIVSEHIIPEGVSSVFLDTCKDATLGTRTIKLKTKLFFKQFKFNMFREESEGYAKLMCELSLEGESVQKDDVAGAHQRIICLTGQFNLDPNRVLDVLLECLEKGMGKADFYISLLRAFGAASGDVCALVGFRFSFYRAAEEGKTAQATPDSVYEMAAVLLRGGLLELGPLSQYLHPKLDALSAHSKRLLDDGAKRGKKAAQPATSAVPSTDIASLDAGGGSGSGGAPIATISVACANTGDDILVDGSRELEAELTTAQNQKLGLLWALLKLRDLPRALDILGRLPEFYGVRCERIAEALCDIVGHMTTSFYEKKCPQYASVLKDLGKEVEEELDGVESIDSWEEMAETVFPLLTCLGPHLSARPVVFSKILRLLGVYVSEAKDPNCEQPLTRLVVDICDEVLLPSLTAVDCNCGLSEEVWSVVGTFQYMVRYRLYGRWKSEHTRRHPILTIRKGQVYGRARYIMKRLSKETVKLIGRQVGKLAHTHPTIVFDYILSQIQTFENLIPPVVDSLRYGLNSMELDVLAFSLIEELANPEKEKLKVSDARLSPWLATLATFAGTVFKKYGGMELRGILQYLTNQLKAGKSFDLMVLREVVESMSGTERTVGLTPEQLAAWTGGDVLRAEGGYFSAKDNPKTTKRATGRLKDALLGEDLVLSLCLLMAQQRAQIVYGESADQPRLHLKLSGQMLDECTETLSQFAAFLCANLRPDDYRRLIPTLPRLVSEFHLSWPTAILLSRPIYINAIANKFDELKKENRKLGIDKTAGSDSKVIAYRKAVESVIKPLAEEIRPLATAKTWNELNPELFLLFWLLTPYDLDVPTAAYERESAKLRKEAAAAEDSKELSDSKRRKEKDRLLGLEAKLKEEQRRQEEHVARVSALIKHWGPGLVTVPLDARGFPLRASTMGQFLTLCLMPRATYSDLDAVYAARFVAALQRLKAPNFYTLYIYDKLMECACVMQSLSEYEASHYGRFLCGLMSEARRWHSAQATFDDECKDSPGFITRVADAANATPASLDFQNFRHLLHKWHWKITRASLVLLNSGSYVAIRNVFNILIKMLPHFPVMKQMHENIQKKVEEVTELEKEKRQDLAVLATSYWGNLKMRGKDKILNESDFHIVVKKRTSTANSEASGSSPVAAPKTALNIIKKTISTNAAPPEKKVIVVTKKEAEEIKKDPPKVIKTTKSTSEAKEATTTRRIITSNSSSPNVREEKPTSSSRKDAAPPPAKKAKVRPQSSVGGAEGVAVSQEEKAPRNGDGGATPDSSSRKREAAAGNGTTLPRSSSKKSMNGEEERESKKPRLDESPSPSRRPPSTDPERRRHKKDRKASRSRSHSKDPERKTVEKPMDPPVSTTPGRSVIVPPTDADAKAPTSRKVVRLSKTKTDTASSERKTSSSKARK